MSTTLTVKLPAPFLTSPRPARENGEREDSIRRDARRFLSEHRLSFYFLVIISSYFEPGSPLPLAHLPLVNAVQRNVLCFLLAESV